MNLAQKNKHTTGNGRYESLPQVTWPLGQERAQDDDDCCRSVAQ